MPRRKFHRDASLDACFPPTSTSCSQRGASSMASSSCPLNARTLDSCSLWPAPCLSFPTKLFHHQYHHAPPMQPLVRHPCPMARAWRGFGKPGPSQEPLLPGGGRNPTARTILEESAQHSLRTGPLEGYPLPQRSRRRARRRSASIPEVPRGPHPSPTPVPVDNPSLLQLHQPTHEQFHPLSLLVSPFVADAFPGPSP